MQVFNLKKIDTDAVACFNVLWGFFCGCHVCCYVSARKRSCDVYTTGFSLVGSVVFSYVSDKDKYCFIYKRVIAIQIVHSSSATVFDWHV